MTPQAAVGALVLAAFLMCSGTAIAQPNAAADDLPTVRLEPPGYDNAEAREPRIRVLIEARDCSARPTVTIIGSWRGRSGSAVLEVSGIERILERVPSAARRTDRIIFRQVRVVRGVARVRAKLVTDWRVARKGRRQCEIRLPRLTGFGRGASAAESGLVRLRTMMDIEPPQPVPQRVNATDHIWACGGGRRNSFDCGLRVISSVADVSADDSDAAPDWAIALLVGLGALTAGGIAVGAAKSVAAAKRTEGGEDVADSWNEQARKEYAKPDEPIGARASQLAKIGTPLAAVIVAVLAPLGGWVSGASPEATVIALSVLLAVTVGGVLYVFAADFRSRSAVAVARLHTLAVHAGKEAQATEEEKAKAEADVREAQAVSKERLEQANEMRREADQKMADATRIREAAESEASAVDERVARAEAKATKVADELSETMDALRRCQERGKTHDKAGVAAPIVSSSYVALGGVRATANGAPVRLFAVESAGAEIIRYLVAEADGRLSWVDEDEIRDIGQSGF